MKRQTQINHRFGSFPPHSPCFLAQEAKGSQISTHPLSPARPEEAMLGERVTNGTVLDIWKEERREEGEEGVSRVMGRGKQGCFHWLFMNVQALAQKWLLSVGGK